MTAVGRAVPHESARGHVTGEALYTDDLVTRFPHALHAWPVCAPHAHARLVSLDANGATLIDAPDFTGEVMFHRQPVAWVLGETLAEAQASAAAVRAEYEPLPAILTIDEAIAAGSFLVGPVHMGRGDLGEIARSPLQFDGELRVGGQEHFYLETQCAIAWLDETGGVGVHCSTQHPSETQEVVAHALHVPRHLVTVECLRMGGAFGGKEVQANVFAAVAAVGATRTRRPVRVRLTRALDMAITGKRHPFLFRYRAGFDLDGRLRGLEATLYSDGGWSLDLSEPILWRALFHVDNAYCLANVQLTGYACRTHKTSQTAFRGFGGPQGMVLIEDVLDQAARRLSLPPHVVRERNFYREGDTTHYGEVVKDAGRIGEIWSQLMASSAFDERRASIDAANARSEHSKRGLAITPVKFGISFTASFFNQAGALVLVYRDGSVQVNHGGTEMGQGLQTKIQQIAATALGVPMGSVRVMHARTDTVPNTSATAASAGTDLNGAAVLDACRIIKERLAPVAAELGDVPFATICETAYLRRIPLFAQGFYSTPGIHFDARTATGKPFHYYAYGAAVSEVEVDGFTGQYRLLRTDILHDVGDSISPLVDRGQIEGGFIQGAGWLTLEELVWDTQGRLATAGASTYKLPSWTELPDTFIVNLLERATEPGVVHGSKAVGEPPLMLAISVREALRDAVAAFGSGGPVHLDSPATPERVFFAVAKRRFLARVGWVFEHSPWVAERAWSKGPFADVDALHAAMVREVESATRDEQLALLRAHPDLGTRARMSTVSAGEQAGAGLDQLTPAEFDRLTRLNAAYHDRHGFPFLFAVKGATTHQILDALEARLERGRDEEFAEALRQVYRIAWFRLTETP